MTHLTTAQIIALTGIPEVTIKRYIKRFPERFTDQAKRTTRGRRYTDEDLALLLLIRRLLSERTKPEDIKQRLESEHLPTLKYMTPLYNLGDMARISREADKRLKDMNQFAHQLRRTRKVYIDHTIALFDFVKKQNEVIQEQAERIQILESMVTRKRKLAAPPKIGLLQSVIDAIEDFTVRPFEKITPDKKDQDH